MPRAAKHKPGKAVKPAKTKVKTRAAMRKKYGAYESYQAYSESIILEPMRELFTVLREEKNQR